MKRNKDCHSGCILPQSERTISSVSNTEEEATRRGSRNWAESTTTSAKSRPVGSRSSRCSSSPPHAPDAHVNLSPRGLDTFRVLGPTAGGVAGPHGQRRRDHSPPQGGRPDHPDVLRLRGNAEDPAPLRKGRGTANRATPHTTSCAPTSPTCQENARSSTYPWTGSQTRAGSAYRAWTSSVPGTSSDLRRAQRSREDGRVQEAQELPEHRRPAGPGSRTCRDYQTSQSRRAGVSPTIVVRWSDGRRTFPSQK